MSVFVTVGEYHNFPQCRVSPICVFCVLYEKEMGRSTPKMVNGIIRGSKKCTNCKSVRGKEEVEYA